MIKSEKEKEIERRRDEALLRALKTPPKTQNEVSAESKKRGKAKPAPTSKSD